MHIHPVILCGGSGTRLWPMSRGGYPKQYLKLTGENTLVQQTALRLRGIDDIASPIIVTNNEQRFLVAEQLRQIGVTPSSIVLEPASRNTAPAIAVAAFSRCASRRTHCCSFCHPTTSSPVKLRLSKRRSLQRRLPKTATW